MAIIKLMHIKEAKTGLKSAPLKRSLEYIFDEKHDQAKTDGGMWVGGNAGRTAGEAYQTMMDTKAVYGKEAGRQGYHFVISFVKGEITPEKAFSMVQEFCDEYLKDNYDHVFTLHTDRDHLHAHLVFNSVGYDGYKYRYEKNDWEKYMQPVMNRICRVAGISEISLDDLEEKRKQRGYMREPPLDRKLNWNVIIREDFDHLIEQSDSYESFIENLKQIGYEIGRSGYSQKHGCNYISVKTKSMERFKRSYVLGQDYTPEMIEYRIRNRDYVAQVRTTALSHPVYRPIAPQLMKMYPVYHIRIQRNYLLRIGCAYRTFCRWQRPFPQAWKYKKDLIDLQKLIDHYNYLHQNRILSSEELEKHKARLEDQKRILEMERRKVKRKKSVSEVEGTADKRRQAEEEIQKYDQAVRQVNRDLRLVKEIEQEAGTDVQVKDLLAQKAENRKQEMEQKQYGAGNGRLF